MSRRLRRTTCTARYSSSPRPARDPTCHRRACRCLLPSNGFARIYPSTLPRTEFTRMWMRCYPRSPRFDQRRMCTVACLASIAARNVVHRLAPAYDAGRTQFLLCIHGLLPISYRQSSYHIPVASWLTRDYPREPPIAYVVPTSDMLVKPGKYMDVSGRCTIEYLQNWARKSEVRVLDCTRFVARASEQFPHAYRDVICLL